jgi:DNA-directed RNA polymerase subunit F
MTDIVKKEIITLPQVKEILEAVKTDDMDQIQRWTFDYVGKFAKVDSNLAPKRQFILTAKIRSDLNE